MGKRINTLKSILLTIAAVVGFIVGAIVIFSEMFSKGV